MEKDLTTLSSCYMAGKVVKPRLLQILLILPGNDPTPALKSTLKPLVRSRPRWSRHRGGLLRCSHRPRKHFGCVSEHLAPFRPSPTTTCRLLSQHTPALSVWSGRGVIPLRVCSPSVRAPLSSLLSSLPLPQHNLPVFKRDDSRGGRVSGSHRCVPANWGARLLETHRRARAHTPGKYHVTRHLGVEKVPESFVEELPVSPFNTDWQIAQRSRRLSFLRNSAFLKPLTGRVRRVKCELCFRTHFFFM